MTRGSGRPVTARGAMLRESLVRLGMCAAGAAVVVAAGLKVREFAAGGWAEHTGTARYAALVYLLVVAVVVVVVTVTALIVPVAVRLRPVTLACATSVLCWLVEFGQLTGAPARWAAHSALSRLVLGTTFQWPDLLWYVIGAVAAGCLHWTAQRWRAGNTSAPVGRRSPSWRLASQAQPSQAPRRRRKAVTCDEQRQ